WQGVKQVDQPRINRLRERFVSFEQVLGIFVKELRVGAQELEKVLERSLEADLLHNFQHFAVDALDFFEADLVNLLRREICGGAAAHEKRVHLLAARDLPDSNLIEAGGQVIAHIKFAEFAECGDD